jgi:pyroglutamyl-peptidase
LTDLEYPRVVKVLLTGFEAFGTTPVNPAQRVAERLHGEIVKGAEIVGLVLPNVFFRSIERVTGAIESFHPQCVIMLGEYGGRSMITVERVCQNYNDSARYELADNSGAKLNGVPTIPGGPVAYHTTLPIRAMVRTMRAAGIPSDISDAPGTNVCNHLMYGVLHHIATNRLPIRAGWIHLPHLPETAARDDHIGAPSMSEETAIAGVLAGIRACLENPHDIDIPVKSRWQI